MTNFIAIVQNGKLTFKNDFMREKFVKFVKFHEGKRVFITPTFKESDKQRGYYEGAIVPLVAYLDGQDYTNTEVLRNVREWLKIEHNGQFIKVKDKIIKIGGSTKGKLNDGFIENVIDWIEDQYGIDRQKVLDPKKFKEWRDEIYPFGGPDDYITYLIETDCLKPIE